MLLSAGVSILHIPGLVLLFMQCKPEAPRCYSSHAMLKLDSLGSAALFILI